jgi:hypothetical protein
VNNFGGEFLWEAESAGELRKQNVLEVAAASHLKLVDNKYIEGIGLTYVFKEASEQAVYEMHCLSNHRMGNDADVHSVVCGVIEWRRSARPKG